MWSEKCFNAKKFFFSFFLDNGKIQGYLPPNVGVPTLPPTLPKGEKKISLHFWMIQTMFKNKKKGFYILVPDEGPRSQLPTMNRE